VYAAPMTTANVVGLSNRPQAPNAVAWSADGVIAVAAGPSAVLLSPGDLAGPRAFASAGNQPDPAVLQAPGEPSDPTQDAHHEVAHLRVSAMASQYPALQAGLQLRGLAWSPAGCSQAAGCLLAVVTNDHQVRRGRGRWAGPASGRLRGGGGARAPPLCLLTACRRCFCFS